MDAHKVFIYRSEDGFYCENCGYLRGYPFNDACLFNCQSEWYHIKDDKDKEYIRSREIQKQKLQKEEARAEDKAHGQDKDHEYIPPIGVAAPLCMQLSIPHLDAPQSYDEHLYNENLTALLNSQLLSSLKLYEERILKNK